MNIEIFVNQTHLQTVTPDQQREVCCAEDDEFGFAVWVHTTDGKRRRFNNVTEVHVNHDGKHTAIESDIHSVGLSGLGMEVKFILIENMGWRADGFEPAFPAIPAIPSR